MNVNLNINQGEHIRAFYLFFIILNIQIGVGILGAPRYIIEHAKQDAWLSILIAYFGMLIILSIMFLILSRYENTDIFGIQQQLFGDKIAKVLGTIYILFFIFQLLSVLITYIEVVKIFLVPTVPSLVLGLMILTLVSYSVLGGLRVVMGVIFLFTLSSLWIIPLLYDPITRMDWTHFLPLFDASLPDLLKGARSTSYTFLGFEILFLIYPFIQNKQHAKRAVYLGATFTTFMLMIATIISIGYFSLEGMHVLAWPVISLYKSTSFSFMERFDYFIIVEWMMVVITTATLLMWSIVHSSERLFNIKQKKSLIIISILLIFSSTYFISETIIRKFTNIISAVGIWIVYVYPLLLLPIVLFKTRRKGEKDVK